MTENALAVRGAVTQVGLLPAANDWAVMLQMSDALFKSGLLPQHVKTPQAALAIVQKGRELGLPPMYALSNIVVISGKPTANAELMAALIYRDHGDDALLYETTDNEACVLSYKRRSWKQRNTYAFTLDDARKAGLLSNQTWQKYPAAMLRARCVSAVARLAFPDSIGGMYTPEELGAAVTVDDDGAVQYSAPAAPASPAHVDYGTGEVTDGAVLAITEATMKRLHAVGREHGWDHAAIKRSACRAYNIEHTGEMTEAQAGQLIAYITEHSAPKKPEPTPVPEPTPEPEPAATESEPPVEDFGDPFGDTPDAQPVLMDTAVGKIQVPRRRTAQSA